MSDVSQRLNSTCPCLRAGHKDSCLIREQQLRPANIQAAKTGVDAKMGIFGVTKNNEKLKSGGSNYLHKTIAPVPDLKPEMARKMWNRG